MFWRLWWWLMFGVSCSIELAAQTPFLQFPISGMRPYGNGIISSAFDHYTDGVLTNEMPGAAEYQVDGVVGAYSGEVGRSSFGSDPAFPKGYRQDGAGTHFTLGGNYRYAAVSDGQYLYYDGHPGIDLAVAEGTAVVAAAAGTVTEAGWFDPNNHSAGVGQYVKIAHDNGYYTIYGHLSRIDVAVNAPVSAGAPLGLSGATGAAAGAHLHFQVRIGDAGATRRNVDPYGYNGSGVLWITGSQNSHVGDWAQSAVFQLDTRDSASTATTISAAFVLDTRITASSAFANSAVFAFDTRAVDGAGGSGVSGTFVLDTRNGPASGLTIVGPASIPVGNSAEYGVAYSSANGVSDVTNQSTFGFVGTVPAWAGIGGNTVFVNRNAPVGSLTLRATWKSNSGQMLSAPLTVNVGQTLLAGMTVTRQRTAGYNFTVTLNGTATGGLPPYTFRWNTGSGNYGDKTGATATFTLVSDGGTRGLGLEVIDGNGTRAYAKSSVTVDKPPVANEPERQKPASDIAAGTVMNTTGQPFVFDPAFTTNGFVLVTHGLRSNGQEFWVRDMADRLQTKLTAHGNRPNVAILDWKDYADPGGEVSPTAIEMLQVLSFLTSAKKIYSAAELGLDALDESVLNQTLKDLIKAKLHELSGGGINWADVAEDLDLFIDLLYIQQAGISEGQFLAAWIWDHARVGEIDPDKPIHLIGHSAGGFVVGECALWLRQHPLPNGKTVWVDRVTMLDTPFPVPAHLNTLPNPVRVERIISSFYGGLHWGIPGPTSYQTVDKLGYFTWLRFGFGENGHGLAHKWYRRTIEPRGEPDGDALDDYDVPGFALSPFMGGPTVPRGGALISMAKFRAFPTSANDLPLTGFTTFGQVVAQNGVYTLPEQANAGCFKQITMPIGAESLKFRFRFTSAGDGDFLQVRFGEGHALYLGMDTVLSRSGFTDVEVPLAGLDGLEDTLTFTLVSRGAANAAAEVDSIRLGINTDPDGDGLSTTLEQTIGTDPLAPDTDQDGLSDGEEYNFTHTNPLLADTDGDGLSDGAEARAGTNPLNANSTFAIRDVGANADGSVHLRWDSQPGKSYRVLRSLFPDFAEFTVVGSAIAATGAGTNFTDTTVDAHSTQAAFYRVQVEDGP